MTINLLEETLEAISDSGFKPEDVKCVSVTAETAFPFDYFKFVAKDVNYNNTSSDNIIEKELKIVFNDGSYLYRDFDFIDDNDVEFWKLFKNPEITNNVKKEDVANLILA